MDVKEKIKRKNYGFLMKINFTAEGFHQRIKLKAHSKTKQTN